MQAHMTEGDDVPDRFNDSPTSIATPMHSPNKPCRQRSRVSSRIVGHSVFMTKLKRWSKPPTERALPLKGGVRGVLQGPLQWALA